MECSQHFAIFAGSVESTCNLLRVGVGSGVVHTDDVVPSCPQTVSVSSLYMSLEARGGWSGTGETAGHLQGALPHRLSARLSLLDPSGESMEKA